jgi:hypothetical protein
MKRPLIALLLLACLPLLCAQKTRYGQEPSTAAKPGVDYPVKVHISGIRIRTYCNEGCVNVLHADAVVDQKRLELTGRYLYDPQHVQVNPVPGDYRARPLKVKHNAAAAPLDNEYELLLPSHYVWRCTVTGMFE